MINLKIGDYSDNGQITIIDEDKLCYLVRSTSRGASGLRTISKALLKELQDTTGYFYDLQVYVLGEDGKAHRPDERDMIPW